MRGVAPPMSTVQPDGDRNNDPVMEMNMLDMEESHWFSFATNNLRYRGTVFPSLVPPMIACLVLAIGVHLIERYFPGTFSVPSSGHTVIGACCPVPRSSARLRGRVDIPATAVNVHPRRASLPLRTVPRRRSFFYVCNARLVVRPRRALPLVTAAVAGVVRKSGTALRFGP